MVDEVRAHPWQIDAIAVMEFFSDISPRFASPFGRSSNPPRRVADRLHALAGVADRDPSSGRYQGQ